MATRIPSLTPSSSAAPPFCTLNTIERPSSRACTSLSPSSRVMNKISSGSALPVAAARACPMPPPFPAATDASAGRSIKCSGRSECLRSHSTFAYSEVRHELTPRIMSPACTPAPLAAQAGSTLSTIASPQGPLRTVKPSLGVTPANMAIFQGGGGSSSPEASATRSSSALWLRPTLKPWLVRRISWPWEAPSSEPAPAGGATGPTSSSNPGSIPVPIPMSTATSRFWVRRTASCSITRCEIIA
mmetsp:Transcript_96966/g.277443  ORF Transcript_96966/g.277443 Transcript_96966/m.277443 type:complete len:244 (-) Transcript_96966:359-1090(-)